MEIYCLICGESRWDSPQIKQCLSIKNIHFQKKKKCLLYMILHSLSQFRIKNHQRNPCLWPFKRQFQVFQLYECIYSLISHWELNRRLAHPGPKNKQTDNKTSEPGMKISIEYINITAHINNEVYCTQEAQCFALCKAPGPAKMYQIPKVLSETNHCLHF